MMPPMAAADIAPERGSRPPTKPSSGFEVKALRAQHKTAYQYRDGRVRYPTPGRSHNYLPKGISRLDAFGTQMGA